MCCRHGLKVHWAVLLLLMAKCIARKSHCLKTSEVTTVPPTRLG